MPAELPEQVMCDLESRMDKTTLLVAPQLGPLAKKLNMSQTGYSKYETGENDVPTHVLIALSKIYNTSVDYLLGLTDDPRRP